MVIPSGVILPRCHGGDFQSPREPRESDEGKPMNGTSKTEPGAAQPNAELRTAWDAFRPDLFSDRIALVTGAAGGMGRETALAFANLGAQVILTDLPGERLDEALARCQEASGRDHYSVAADVSAPAGIASIYSVVDVVGRLDHVAACAAVLSTVSALDETWDHWHRIQDINAGGTYFVLQEAYRRMIPNGSGTLVAVASDAGKRGGGGLVADGAYGASKASVLSMVKSFAREFAKSGVRINALTPGPSDTTFFGNRLTDELRALIGNNLPIGRMGTAPEMSAAIIFLSSPAASFVYGSSFNVDGGSMFE